MKVAIYHAQYIGKHSEIGEANEKIGRVQDKICKTQLEIFLDNTYSALIGQWSLLTDIWT